MDTIRIVLIEDHDLTRVGLKAAMQQQPDMTVVAETGNGKTGLSILREIQPDVAVIDIGLPDIDGVELTRQYKESQGKEATATRILILTMHDNEEAVMAAFAAGADSYSVKDVDIEQLIEAIRVTHAGNAWIDPTIARIVLNQAQQQQVEIASSADEANSDSQKADYEQVLAAYPLTDRELEVLELIVAGYSNAAIAEALYITVGTVKTHVCNILNKLSASDRTQAAVRALRTGLVS
ncbi:MAG: response regulator transcription factor [Leptolyngbyaceae cyanobacterium SM1_1_3]|nr:response regulator transcription factor [Leptolyngbyaceae cyanobacterium SM1_1_3]NJM85248.1 response regulator transcription factor [Leptolyngbyaceae cyanobacterium RM2_2_21]NJN01127.1 response regulator transcription factor [Leptolyngbyaceae cyanobacterium RM1_1_2]NJO10040.1 response regulator transcription factor [Leptolyngbyaceae cyanobacterium SL_1_1]